MIRTLALVAMVCPLLLIAQQKTRAIDSLEQLLQSQKGAALAETYANLTWEYRTVDRNEAIAYGNKAVRQAKSSNSLALEAQAYNDLGIIYYDKEDYDSALYLYNTSLKIRTQLKDDLGIARLHNKLGIVFQKQGLFEKALEHQLSALTLFEKENDERGISYSLNNIGIINQNLGRYTEAVQYYERSIKIKEELGDKYGLASTFVNIANICQINKNYSDAEAYYKEAVKITRELGDKEYLSNALNNLGQLYYQTEKYSKALPLIRESFKLRSDLKDTKGMVSCMINLGDIYTAQKKFDSAKVFLEDALAKAQTAVNCQPEISQALLSLSVLYENTGNSIGALEMYKRYASTRDTMFTEHLGQKVAEMEARFKNVEHQRTIEQQQFQLKQKNYWLAGAITILMFSKLLIYWYYRRYKHRQKIRMAEEISRQQELSAKAVMLAIEEERQRIARDLHDGLGQMMSAVKMNLSAFESNFPATALEHHSSLSKIISLVDESCREIRQVSHNLMLNTSGQKTLAESLKDFINKIDHKALNVHLYTEGLDQKLDTNTEVMLYRIIQECVNNVIKHARASTLDITIIRDAESITANIEDNGKGFDILDKTRISGLGLKNIQTRVEYLKGSIDIDSAPGRGTVVSLQIPLAS